jgi:hypothetical protein
MRFVRAVLGRLFVATANICELHIQNVSLFAYQLLVHFLDYAA